MTWNPSDKAASLTLSNSDRSVLKASADAIFAAVRSTLGATVKRYAEVLINQGSTSPFITVGLANGSMALSLAVGQDANGWCYYEQTGEKYNGGTLTAFGASYTSGDVVGVAYDPVAGKVWFSKNNTWQGSGDPAAGTNPAFSGLASGLFLAVSLYRSSAPANSVTGRFVSEELGYSPPSGFSAWTDPPAAGQHRMFSIFN